MAIAKTADEKRRVWTLIRLGLAQQRLLKEANGKKAVDMSQLRLLMATNIPFWRSSTGAEQRILHLVLALSKLESPQVELKTFYVGPVADEDQTHVERHTLNVDFRNSDQIPTGLARTLKWHFDGMVNLAKQSLAKDSNENSPGTAKATDESPASVRLQDFRWPWALGAFKETVSAFQPNVILSQYVTMSYLLEALTTTQRETIHCAVDTHDVLSQRAQQFATFGYRHWIDINQSTEAAAISKFDSVWAIHESERSVFQRMAPKAKVIVAGHSIQPLLNQNSSESESHSKLSSSSPLTIGYIASNNRSNSHALSEFLAKAWALICKTNPQIEFVIAGGICKFVEQSQLFKQTGDGEVDTASNIRCLGRVDDLKTFYNQVDIVINPVSFGTGLKIKNCEAIAFGKPSIVTANGADALPVEIGPATLVAESVSEMAQPILELAGQPERLQELNDAAFDIGKTLLCDQTAYRELFEHLSDLR